jgi:hypothetical protein
MELFTFSTSDLPSTEARPTSAFQAIMTHAADDYLPDPAIRARLAEHRRRHVPITLGRSMAQ